jgi:hypothetical protein
MTRSALFCCVLLMTSLPVHSQEAKPLASLDLDLNRLKTWGTRTYSYEATRPGNKEKVGGGRVVLKTEVGADSIILGDTFILIYGGKELSLHLTHQCRKDSFLSPVRIESKGEGDDELKTFVATIDGGKATIRSGNGVREIELPEGTVSSWAFFRLVTLLPRQKGSRISYPYSLESEELNLKKNFLVECLGWDTVQSGQEGITCTKFQLTDGGVPNYYWVDDDGLLRQVLIDELKLIRLQDGPDEN